MPTPGKEELRRQLLRSVEGLSSEAIRVDGIHCSLAQRGNAATLHARYALSGPPSPARGLLILESIGRYHPSIVISAVNASVTWGPHDPRGGPETAAIAMIDPNPGFRWNDVEVSIECEVTAEAVGSEVMLLPDYLPLPVVDASTGSEPAPLLRLTFDRSLASMIKGGIPYEPALPWHSHVGGSCQAAVLLDESGTHDPGEELQAIAVKLVETLGMYLGRPAETALVFIPRTARGAARLAGFILDDDRYRTTSGESFADYAQLTEHLVGIWWGGGCRIGGPQGEKIESTIRLAIMMHLGCRSAKSIETRESILRDFEQNSDFSLAARLCRFLGSGSVAGLAPIRQITSAFWAKCVPERVVLEALAPSLNALR